MLKEKIEVICVNDEWQVNGEYIDESVSKALDSLIGYNVCNGDKFIITVQKDNSSDSNINKLQTLNGKILSDEEFESLQENPFVKTVECLGTSGFHIGATWWDVCLTDGTFMDVYTK